MSQNRRRASTRQKGKKNTNNANDNSGQSEMKLAAVHLGNQHYSKSYELRRQIILP